MEKNNKIMRFFKNGKHDQPLAVSEEEAERLREYGHDMHGFFKLNETEEREAENNE